MTLKNIIWLASYPKSGNTWTRVFLANYIFNPAEPMPINQVHRLGMGDATAKAYLMVASGHFNPADNALTLGLRPKMLRGIVNNRADINFVKSHNIKGKAFGQNLIPVELTKRAVYIVRDPRDMVISYASHYGHTLDDAIESISRSDTTVTGGGELVTQYLGGWSDHVKAWTKASDFPVLAQRYEDMISSPKESFQKLLKFIGLPIEEEKLQRAISFSSIGEMQKQEKVQPFIERSAKTDTFFGRGTSGHWREVLSEQQSRRIEEAHGPTMRKFGYL